MGLQLKQGDRQISGAVITRSHAAATKMIARDVVTMMKEINSK